MNTKLLKGQKARKFVKRTMRHTKGLRALLRSPDIRRHLADLVPVRPVTN